MGKVQDIRNEAYDAIRKGSERLNTLRSQETDEAWSAFLEVMSQGMKQVKQISIEHTMQREVLAKQLYEEYRISTDDKVRESIILRLLTLGVDIDTIYEELGDVKLNEDAALLVKKQAEGVGDVLDLFCGIAAEVLSLGMISDEEGDIEN